MKVFRFLTGDVDWKVYGAKWYKRIAPGIYHIIELANMKENLGDEATYTYYVTLHEVNLNIVNKERISEALSCCGVFGDREEPHELEVIDALDSYGITAPLAEWSGNNYKKLLKAAKDFSYELEKNPYKRELLLNRPVNLLGVTAREYQRGDLYSIWERILND